jgi:hypothetical protein
MKRLQNHLILSSFRNDERARMSERARETDPRKWSAERQEDWETQKKRAKNGERPDWSDLELRVTGHGEIG